MSPTVRKFDVLYVSSYRGNKVRSGDVVVFKSAGQPLPVVHRVLSQDAFGIRTIGDNNETVDEGYLNLNHIVGRVVYLKRGSKLKRVHGGWLGSLVGRIMRLRRLLDYRISRIAHPLYDLLVRYKIFMRWPCSIRTKVVSFAGNGAEDLQLLWRGRVIGWFEPDMDNWVIRRPFRLIVDQSLLPGANPNNKGTDKVPPVIQSGLRHPVPR
jgi:hypothetical protein